MSTVVVVVVGEEDKMASSGVVPSSSVAAVDSGGWNRETKARLTEKVAVNVNDLASLTRQVLRGSKTNELLEKAAKNFASQDFAIDNSLTTLKKMGLLVSHLQFQVEAADRSIRLLDDVQDHIKTIQRCA